MQQASPVRQDIFRTPPSTPVKAARGSSVSPMSSPIKEGDFTSSLRRVLNGQFTVDQLISKITDILSGTFFELSSMKQTLAERDTRILNVELSYSQAIETIEEKNITLKERDIYILTLEEANEQIFKKTEEVQREHARLQGDFYTLEKTTQELSGNCSVLRDQSVLAEVEKTKLLAQVEDLHSTVDYLKNRCRSLESTYEALVIQEQLIQVQAQLLEQKHTELEEKYEHCAEEHEKLKRHTGGLQIDFDELATKYGVLEQTTDMLDIKCGDLDRNYTKLQKLLQQINRSRIKMEEEKEAQKTEIDRLQQELEVYHKPYKIFTNLFTTVAYLFSLTMQLLVLVAKKIYALFTGCFSGSSGSPAVSSFD